MPTCYSNDFKKEFQSNLTYLFKYLFRANFKKRLQCNKMCYYLLLQSNNNLQSHSNHDIIFNSIFRYSLDYIKYFMPSILNTAQYFRSILIKGVYGTLFIMTQNAHLYTPELSHTLYISIFVCILHAYKVFSPIFNYVLRSEQSQLLK